MSDMSFAKAESTDCRSASVACMTAMVDTTSESTDCMVAMVASRSETCDCRASMRAMRAAVAPFSYVGTNVGMGVGTGEGADEDCGRQPGYDASEPEDPVNMSFTEGEEDISQQRDWLKSDAL